MLSCPEGSPIPCSRLWEHFRGCPCDGTWFEHLGYPTVTERVWALPPYPSPPRCSDKGGFPWIHTLGQSTVSSPFLPTCSVVPPHTPVQLSIQVCLPLPPSSLPLPQWVHEARDNVCFVLCCVPSTSYSAGAQCISESKWENDRNSLAPRLPPGPGTAHQPPLSRAKFTGLQMVLGACYLLTGFWGISNTEINT